MVHRAIWFLAAASNAMLLAALWWDGMWLQDAFGDPIMHDYLAQWAAGRRVLSGEASLVYDRVAHIALQKATAGLNIVPELYFMYPPHFLFSTVTFVWLDYVPAMVAFLATTVALYALALRSATGCGREAMAVALSGGGALTCLWWANNGFLTAAILVSALTCLERRPILSGIFMGLLTVKPQLGILLPVILIVGGYWRTLLSASATALACGAAAEVLLGPGIWAAFMASAGQTGEFVGTENLLHFKMQSVYATMHILYGPTGAFATHALLVLACVATVAWTWRREISHWFRCALVVPASLLAAPYLYSYDAVMLTASAAFIARAASESGRPIEPWEWAVVMTACIVPSLYMNLFSAAVPVACLLMACVVVRRIAHESESGTQAPVGPVLAKS